MLKGETPFARHFRREHVAGGRRRPVGSPKIATAWWVAAVEPDSNAANVQFQKGDMILSINGKAIKSTRDPHGGATTRPARLLEAVGAARAGRSSPTLLNG